MERVLKTPGPLTEVWIKQAGLTVARNARPTPGSLGKVRDRLVFASMDHKLKLQQYEAHDSCRCALVSVKASFTLLKCGPVTGTAAMSAVY